MAVGRRLSAPRAARAAGARSGVRIPGDAAGELGGDVVPGPCGSCSPARQPARDGIRRWGSAPHRAWLGHPHDTAAEGVQRCEAAACGVGLHDEDRRGDKGFHYLGAGFATTPTGSAMRAHFRATGDPDTAALFGDSSMEQVARAAPGPEAPLCLVTEVPLFRVSGGAVGRAALRARLPALTMRAQRGAPVTDELARFGVEPVDPRVAIRLLLRAIELGLAATDRPGRPRTAGGRHRATPSLRSGRAR